MDEAYESRGEGILVVVLVVVLVVWFGNMNFWIGLILSCRVEMFSLVSCGDCLAALLS